MFSTVWNTQRFTELDREEMGEKRDRGHLVEKKESPKEERVVKPVITSLCVLHSLDHSRGIHGVIQGRGEGGSRQRWPGG